MFIGCLVCEWRVGVGGVEGGEMKVGNMFYLAWRAVGRARSAILSVAVVYAVSVAVGVVLVHTGNEFALSYADSLVAQAEASDASAIALQKGDRLRAALFDFGENLLLGAVPSTATGLGVVFAYPLVAFRGWIGGVVSVNTDEAHTSRLSDPGEAAYYLSTLVLQLIPYSLAGGAGVNVGMSAWRARAEYEGEKWLGFSKEAIRDIGRIYLLVVPLFLVASLWEFLLR